MFLISVSAICSADPVSAAAEAVDCAPNCEMATAIRSYVLASSRYPATRRRASSPLGGFAVEGLPNLFSVLATSPTLSTAAAQGLLFWPSRAAATNAIRLARSRRACARFFR